MGEFPEGEAPGASGEQTAGGQDGSAEGAEAGGEPGFGDMAGAGSAGVPDLTDEPSFEEVMAGMEDAMGEPGGAAGSSAGEQGAGQQGSTGGTEPGGTPGGGYPGIPGGTGTGGGSGPLTPAEQVAILDARLEKGTGEFDTMILEEQMEQRDTARERSKEGQIDSVESGSGGSGDGEGTADAGEYGSGGGYSSGGGMGGVGGGSGGVPQDTAKYPPPKDIPSGNDDDVVARQLREAAMREPDPAVREKLWDEYRKYKGISE
jgi:hypothetical protein